MTRAHLVLPVLGLLWGCAGVNDGPITQEERDTIAGFCGWAYQPDFKDTCVKVYTSASRTDRLNGMTEVVFLSLDGQLCEQDGAARGTPPYAQCMATRKLARAQEAANNRPPFVYGGNSGPPPIPMAAPIPAFVRHCISLNIDHRIRPST